MSTPRFGHGSGSSGYSTGDVQNSDRGTDISDDESYFSSSYEPEFLKRLSLAIANETKHARRSRVLEQRAAIRSWPSEQDWYAFRRYSMGSDDGACVQSVTTTQSTVGTCWYSSDEESTDIAGRGKDPSPVRPEHRSPSRGRTRTRARRSSSADCALPQIVKEAVEEDKGPPGSDDVLRDEHTAEAEAGFVTAFRTRLMSKQRVRRAQHDMQSNTYSVKHIVDCQKHTPGPKIDVSSPALAKRLGVPVSSQVDLWM